MIKVIGQWRMEEEEQRALYESQKNSYKAGALQDYSSVIEAFACFQDTQDARCYLGRALNNELPLRARLHWAHCLKSPVKEEVIESILAGEIEEEAMIEEYESLNKATLQ